MKLIERTIAWVTAVCVLVAVGMVVAFAGRTLVSRAAALHGDVANVTFVACAVVLAAAWWISRAVVGAGRRTRAATLREEQAATYQLLLDYWLNRAERPTSRVGAQAAEFEGKVQALERLLAIYGNAAVIAAHTRLREGEL